MVERRHLREGFPELTIEEMMTDPMIRDLMQVDHVDPDAFQELLCRPARWRQRTRASGLIDYCSIARLCHGWHRSTAHNTREGLL